MKPPSRRPATSKDSWPPRLIDLEGKVVKCSLDVEGEITIEEKCFPSALGVQQMMDVVRIRGDGPNYRQHFDLTELIAETEPTLVVREAVELLSQRLVGDAVRRRDDVSRLLLCCEFSLPPSKGGRRPCLVIHSETIQKAADLGVEIEISF